MNSFAMRQKAVEYFLRKRFPQQKLLDPVDFSRFCEKRGFHGSVGEANLETWDRTGVFHPLLKVPHPFTLHLAADTGFGYDPTPLNREPHEDENIVQAYASPLSPEHRQQLQGHEHELVPQVETFRPWKDYRLPTRFEGATIQTTSILYHPYQLFDYARVCNACTWSIRLPEFGSNKELHDLYKQVRRQKSASLASLRKSEEDRLQSFLLLLLIEDVYLPRLREHITFPYESWRGLGPSRQWGASYRQWSEGFDAAAVLNESALTLDQVREIREHFAERGRDLDPAHRWYEVIRHATYEHRQELEGDALLAWDYYEVAEILGLFLEDLTGERQLHVDDLVSLGMGRWKEQAYGVRAEEVDYGRANALPAILRHFGLDPRNRVWLFLEGESENAFASTWLEGNGILFKGSRIVLVEMGGVSGLDNSVIRNQVQQARDQDACVYVAVDTEGKKEERLGQLNGWIDKGWIVRIIEDKELRDPASLSIGAILWHPCFEDHNFTFEELVTAWREFLIRNHGEDALNEDGFHQAVEAARSYKGQTLIGDILNAAKQHSRALLKEGRARIPRKPDVARVLAEQHLRSNDKPIIILLTKALHVAGLLHTAQYRP